MELGYCELCKKKLVAIGRDRSRGKKTHTDWKTRKYHKKCYIIIKDRELLDRLYSGNDPTRYD
jgi:hypothetical protein